MVKLRDPRGFRADYEKWPRKEREKNSLIEYANSRRNILILGARFV